MRTNYPSDLTDGQWQLIRRLLPKAAKTGRPRIDRRWIINAILYLNRTGCQWRALPHDFPKWKTVYTVFWRWRKAGVWANIHEALCRRLRRVSSHVPRHQRHGPSPRARGEPIAEDVSFLTACIMTGRLPSHIHFASPRCRTRSLILLSHGCRASA